MKIKLHTTGLFQNGMPAEDMMLCFEGNFVKLSEVYAAALKLFREQGVLFDEGNLLMATDGKVVPQKHWGEYQTMDGQTFHLFPPLAGG